MASSRSFSPDPENVQDSRLDNESYGRKQNPTHDESLAHAQHAARKSAGSPDDGYSSNGSRQTQKKRKNDDRKGEGSKKQRKQPDQQKPAPEKKPTAVYVTGLPRNTTINEIRQVFGRFGVIAEELESSEPRIKIYKNDDGTQKGEALVVYFRPESVDMAVEMLDDSDFRFGQAHDAEKMRVEVADRSYKKHQDPAAAGDQPAENGPSKPHRPPMDKQKAAEKARMMNEKLADWSDEEPQTQPETTSERDKVVVLKHMFTLQEIKDDPEAAVDIKEDIREECSKMGPVTNTVLYDKEPEGIVTVRFSTADAANACVLAMDGRSFGGQVVKAMIFEPRMKFQKSVKGGSDNLDDLLDNDGEDEEGEVAAKKGGKDKGRLHDFAEWIEDDD